MSNQGPVRGAGNSHVPDTPYTSGAPDNTGKTGQSDSGRKITPKTGESRIPGRPEGSSLHTGAPLSKRKVAHHPAKQQHLRPMPDSDGYRHLGSGAAGKDQPSPAGDPDSTTPAPRSQPPGDSTTGQLKPPGQNAPGVNPKVSVQLPDGVDPLPPMTQKQTEQANKLFGAFTAFAGLIKEHKNTFAMVGGGVAMGAGLVCLFFPVTIPAAAPLLAVGYVGLITGFSFAMMNTADSGGPTPPPEPPKNEDDENAKKKNGPGDEPNPPSSGDATPKGHFARISHSEPVVTTSEPPEPLVTSAQAMAEQRRLASLKYHMETEIQAAIDRDDQKKTQTEETTSTASATANPSTLEQDILMIAAQYAVRAGLQVDSTVLDNIVESGRLMAEAMKDMENMTQLEREAAFQKLFLSLAQQPGISPEAMQLLRAGIDTYIQERGDTLNEAVKVILDSTLHLLNAIIEQSSDSESTAPDTARTRPVSLVDLEKAINGIHDPDQNLHNIVHIRELRDAIETQGKKVSMPVVEVEQMKKRLLTDALALVDTSMAKKDFKAALVARVSPTDRANDLEFLNKALEGHAWFKGSSSQT